MPIFVIKVTTNKEDKSLEMIQNKVEKKNLPVLSKYYFKENAFSRNNFQRNTGDKFCRQKNSQYPGNYMPK